MKRFLTLMTVSSLITMSACGADSGQAQEAGSPTATAGAAVSAGASADVTEQAAVVCAACHSGPLSFAGRDPAQIAQLITDINDGAKAHPPLNLAATDPDSIRSLALALTQN